MGEARGAYRISVGNHSGKRPLGRRRRRWDNRIKMDFRDVGYEDGKWIELARDRG